MTRYSYTVSGTAARDQTWEVKGEISVPDACVFPGLVTDILRRAFDALTEGRATYGRPGGGCQGPYKIDRLLVERWTVPVDRTEDMTIYKTAHYYALAPIDEPPVGALRSPEKDWRQLTLTEQMYVEGWSECRWPLSAVPVRGQVFIRRHHKES